MDTINWQQDEPQKENTSHAGEKSSRVWMVSTLVLIGIILGFGMGKITASTPRSTAVVSVLSAPAPASQGRITPPTTANLLPVDFKQDHIRGNKNATVAIIEYSDFECPFCKRAHPTFQKIVDTYGDKVMWVYRHFPLSFHANAEKEAEASECAGELGGNDAFWKYADGIFAKTTSNGTGFALDQLGPLAKEIGLSQKKFKECLDSGKYSQHVQEDIQAGELAGVTGTPGNFVVHVKTQKNQVVEGAQPFASFQRAIDAMLQ